MADPLSYHAGHGEATDPRERAELLDDLPRDIPALCRIVQGLMIHVGWAKAYGLDLSDARPRELAIRTVAQQLRFIRTLNPLPLTVARPMTARMLGTCRDFALLLCAILRHQGVPARVRCGFATYLGPNRYEDHWVCEHWLAQERRWRMTDAQLDAVQCDQLNVAFDTTDLPAGRFLTAGQVWRMCRAGQADFADCGQQAATGAWFIRVNVMRDLLALARTEISPWDTWRQITPENQALSDEEMARCDQFATLAENGDRLNELVATLPGALAPPWLG